MLSSAFNLQAGLSATSLPSHAVWMEPHARP